MPNHKAALKYKRDLTRLENEYIKIADSLYRGLRKTLMGMLHEYGVSSQAFRRGVRTELDAFKSALDALREKYVSQILELEGALTSAELDYFGQWATLPDAGAVDLSTKAERHALVNDAIENMTAYVDTINARMQSTISRVASDTDDAAYAALFALRPVAGRVSEWRHGRTLIQTESQKGLWAAGAAALFISRAYVEAESGLKFKRQAIAAIDERTTDTCLRVHGQVVKMNEPFELTGTPRFADRVKNPPFHWNCRTVTALYLDREPGHAEQTSKMEDAAKAELKARRDDSRKEIHPAHAISRRK